MSSAGFEIFNQYDALNKTGNYLSENMDAILRVVGNSENFVFFGCGSSFSLAKSGAAIAAMYGAGKAAAVAAGDFIVNFDTYRRLVDGACLFMLSRSGRTSEMLIAAEMIRREKINCTVVSICATENAPMAALSDYSAEIPWAFDESVCQTRTVSNLYMGVAIILAERYGDKKTVRDFGRLIAGGDAFLRETDKRVEPAAKGSWKNVVVLTDGTPCGIAEEGALAFNEICMCRSNYYHLLDLRHGPMVLLNRETLVVMLMSSDEHDRQAALLDDIKRRGCYVVCVSSDKNYPAADIMIDIPDYCHTVKGLALLNTIQCITLGMALAAGNDPDHPTGLDPWIKL